MKKMFPRAHIEPAKNWEALMAYCNKEETRVDALPTTDEKYPSQARMFSMFADWIDANTTGPEPGRKGG